MGKNEAPQENQESTNRVIGVADRLKALTDRILAFRKKKPEEQEEEQEDLQKAVNTQLAEKEREEMKKDVKEANIGARRNLQKQLDRLLVTVSSMPGSFIEQIRNVPTHIREIQQSIAASARKLFESSDEEETSWTKRIAGWIGGMVHTLGAGWGWTTDKAGGLAQSIGKGAERSYHSFLASLQERSTKFLGFEIKWKDILPINLQYHADRVKGFGMEDAMEKINKGRTEETQFLLAKDWNDDPAADEALQKEFNALTSKSIAYSDFLAQKFTSVSDQLGGGEVTLSRIHTALQAKNETVTAAAPAPLTPPTTTPDSSKAA